MNNNLHNRKYLFENRKNLRNNSTSAEAVLWTYLSNRKFEGRKFRRQHSIKDYIVDFYCAEEKVIIELDGRDHDNVGMQVADEYRDEELKAIGFKVLRFENVSVFEGIDGLLGEIRANFKWVSRDETGQSLRRS